MAAITKKRLQKYLELLHDIEYQKERLARTLSAMTSPGSPSFDDLPRGTDDEDRMTNAIARKDKIEGLISELEAQEAEEYYLIEQAVKALPKADERLVIRARYFDDYSWDEVCAALYGHRRNYWKKLDSYLRTTHRIHSRALINLQENED